MLIRFLVLGVKSTSGGARSVVNQANALVEHHDVEVVSMFRGFKKLPFPLDKRVRRRQLFKVRRPWYRQKVYDWLAGKPSTLIPESEGHYAKFSRATDIRLKRYLGSLEGGVLVTTRPSTNLLAARFASPSVVTIGQDHMNFRSYPDDISALIRQWYPKLGAVVTLTKLDAEEFREALGPDARVETIPNMVPWREIEPAPLDSKVAIAAGRLTPQKGFDMLVKAFAKVTKEHPDWEMRIFGSGSYRDDLRERIEQAGMTEHVKLMGITRDLEGEMRNSAFYVLSSRYEGLPMTVLESMQQGVPVVAFDCHTGPGDVITHDHDGLLVPPGNVNRLAKSIEALIEDPQRRRELGAAAHRSVERYSAESVRPLWEKLYQELGAI